MNNKAGELLRSRSLATLAANPQRTGNHEKQSLELEVRGHVGCATRPERIREEQSKDLPQTESVKGSEPRRMR
jgi:hypothetical protein